MLKKIISLATLASIALILTGCNRQDGWPENLYVMPATDPEHAFVNVHFTNPFIHDVLFTIEGIEYEADDQWHLIPLHPDHDETLIIQNSEITYVSGQRNGLSSIVRFDQYFHPDYPITGNFRLSGRIDDINGDYLRTLNSNEFTIDGRFQFE